jgi:hypothetical protein
MSLEKRLEELEKQFKSGEQANSGGGISSREWTVFFHAHENARRVQYGLEALPPLKYTEEDRSNDLDTLEHVIPVYRASAGWREEKDQAWLDRWEEQLKERINGKERHD